MPEMSILTSCFCSTSNRTVVGHFLSSSELDTIPALPLGKAGANTNWLYGKLCQDGSFSTGQQWSISRASCRRSRMEPRKALDIQRSKRVVAVWVPRPVGSVASRNCSISGSTSTMAVEDRYGQGRRKGENSGSQLGRIFQRLMWMLIKLIELACPTRGRSS